jgi:hypothetical protein
MAFVLIRVYSWLKTFLPSGRRATKSVSAMRIKYNHDPGYVVTVTIRND